MIPVQLSLQNFLSYPSAVLDLSGIHTACVCGANGAGKSSLLEALTWGIWGQSRSGNDEDLIHTGATEVQVRVTYQSQGQLYRVLRTRARGGPTRLEWQIQTETGWRALTQRGVRATQAAIQSQLRLDYETFINSAYLRQGRADEFTLKRPGERKQILSEILKLGQYERLAERCRDRGREAKVQLQLRQEQLDQVRHQQAQRDQIEQTWRDLLARQTQVQEAYQQDQVRHQRLQQQREQRLSLQQRYQDLTQQLDALTATLRQTELQWRRQRQHQQDLEGLLARQDQIEVGCQRYQELLARDRDLNQGFLHRQTLQLRHQTLQTRWAQQRQQGWQRIKPHQDQLTTLQARQRLDDQLLQRQAQIESAWQIYRQARSDLRAWQRQQAEAAPWLAAYQECLDRKQQQRQRILAERAILQHQVERLQQQQQQIQQVEAQAVAVQVELQELERQRHYHQQVQEKLQERRLFVQQLQERQRSLQRQWQGLEHHKRALDGAQGETDLSLGEVCPLCEQPLDPQRKTMVLHRQVAEQQEIEGQLFVIREQLAVADREIQLLREEDQVLARQLQGLDHQLLCHGRLQHQLETGQSQQDQLQTYQQQLADLDLSLAQETYASDLEEELQRIQQRLTEIGYDEQHHRHCREEVDRWRWAEGKQIELQRAQHRRSRLRQQIQQLESEIQALATEDPQGDEQGQSLQEQLAQIESEWGELGYDFDHHQQIRSELMATQGWLTQWQALQQAQQQYPLCKDQCDTLLHQLQDQQQTLMDLSHEIESLHQQLSQIPPVSATQIETLATQLQQQRQTLDQILSQLGAVEQQWQQVSQLEERRAQWAQQVQAAHRSVQIHQELAQAFGRNGIPALIMETVLPELESEANQILSRLTDHQLHLQFVTQRSSRRSQKVIDTLDILIADPRGTRPYETYSGGEAFRINFAIRLALSRLLAQRSGAHLQTLLIDEGFGTQDPAGRQHLVAAINAVAPDFARILVITHIPSLQDAFPHRIEVYKGAEGSQLRVRT